MIRISNSTRDTNVAVLEAQNRSNNRMISHLNKEVDFLRQITRDMETKFNDCTVWGEEIESQLVHYKSENEVLNSRNDELEKELSGVDSMAKLLQSDKDLVVKTADREMLEAKTELLKSRQDFDSLDLTVSQLEVENKRLDKEYKGTKAVLGKKQHDVIRLEELLDRVQEDKRRLSHRVNTLVANEKELVMENERLKRRNGPASGNKGKIPSKLDAFIRTVEEERNYYRDQSEALQNVLRGTTDVLSCGANLVRSRPSSRSGSCVRKNSTTKTDKKVVTEDSEVARLTRERDDMRLLLSNLENHMVEIQTNVKLLTAERNEFNAMYEQTKEELQRARRDIVKSPKSPKTSLAALSVLRRVENEKDEALSDLRRITTERDSLWERQQTTTESFLSERTKQEQTIENLEANLDAVDARRRELLEQMMELKDVNSELEEQMSGLDQANKFVKDEVSQHRATINLLDREKDALQSDVDEKTKKEIRLNVDLIQKEKEIDDLNLRNTETDSLLTHRSDTLSIKQRELESLELQLQRLSEDLDETSRAKEIVILDNGRLQNDLAVATREKQKLNRELENCLEEKECLQTKNRRTEELLSSKEKERADLEERCRILSVEVESLHTEIDEMEDERSGMQHEIMTRDSELFEKKNKLFNLEKEVHELNFEYDDMEHEKELLHTQLNSEKALVKNLEETLKANQENEFQSQLAAQETHSEVQMLKDRLLLNEINSQRQSRDVAALKAENAKLEADTQLFRRQVATGKFERDRAVQELCRNGIPPPTLIPDYST